MPFEYKLNVNPRTLRENEDRWEEFKTRELPHHLSQVLEMKAEKGNEVIYNIKTDMDQNILGEEYQDMLKDTYKLIDMYNEISNKYSNEGEIIYSNQFIGLNKKLMDKRRKLEEKKPFIRIAYKVIPDNIIKENFTYTE